MGAGAAGYSRPASSGGGGAAPDSGVAEGNGGAGGGAGFGGFERNQPAVPRNAPNTRYPKVNGKLAEYNGTSGLSRSYRRSAA